MKGETIMDAILLSNYVISLFEETKVPITNLKLQKVLYYIQGYFYKNFERPAFADEIHKWQYGPVVPTVYYEYNSYGSLPLNACSAFEHCKFNSREEHLIKSIVEKCSYIATSKLVSMTHSERPWIKSILGDVINNKDIELFFKNNDPLGISI